MKTLLEEFIADLNANIFFAEFAFAATELTVPGEGQVELADHLILIGEIGLAFQLKERNKDASSDPRAVKKWFENKVYKTAVRQLSTTRRLLVRFQGATLKNHRGHSVAVLAEDIDDIHGIVIYRAPNVQGYVAKRYYNSKSAGFVHFLSAADYLGLCRLLVTPTEISEYLAFRRVLLSKEDEYSSVPEQALLGQFIAEESDAKPSADFSRVTEGLIDDSDEWDLSFFTQQFGGKIVYREGDQSITSHYGILRQFARLSRAELRAFKQRLRLCIDAAASERQELPYRFACSRTSCGFVLIPLSDVTVEHARKILTALTLMCKHDFGVKVQVGLTIVRRSAAMDIEWAYLDSPISPNPKLDMFLKTDSPFRPTSDQIVERYSVQSKALDSVMPRATSRPLT